MSGQTILILLVAGAVIAAFAILNALPRRQLARLKVRPKPLMTPAERRVCLMIERAMPGARVHAQVSMGAIMNPAKGLSKSEWWTTFNKFSSKRVDFVVEDPHSGQVILLVELDDRSHDRRNDTDRDALTRHAGYTTVRLPAGERPTQTSVERHIEAALGPALPRADRSPWQATQT
ncbi:MAG: DUF2726 domain-containing protein [Verrucomicrobiales bacterium]|jgi:hypothetical protein|nr:DUF2726 domain-containing protein [Verrucomicrobiales bacterium]